MRFACLLIAALLVSVPTVAQDNSTETANDQSGRINLQSPGELGLAEILDSICEQSSYGYSLSADVSETVNVFLKDATIEEALDAVLTPLGLMYSIKNGTVFVFNEDVAQRRPDLLPAANPLETRVYRLQHTAAVSVQDAVGTLVGEGGSFQIVPNSVPRGWSLGGEVGAQGSTRGSEQAYLDETRSRIFTVRAPAETHDEIAALLSEIDTERRQIYISVVLFEISGNEQEQVGLKWKISSTLSGSGLPWNFPFGRSDLGEYTALIDANDDFAPPLGEGIFPEIPGSSNAGGGEGPFLFGTVNMTGTELMFELNRLGATTNTVTNEQITATDQEEAIILVGERFPIVTATVSDQGTVTESFDRYEPIGIQLQVVPVIQGDDHVELLLHPMITQLGNLVVGTTGLTAPRINTREFQTRVKIRNSQTVVIAGLVSERTAETTTAVPFLSKIPLLGRLFRHKSISKEKVRLVVCVTPYIGGTGADQNLRKELQDSSIDTLRSKGEPKE